MSKTHKVSTFAVKWTVFPEVHRKFTESQPCCAKKEQRSLLSLKGGAEERGRLLFHTVHAKGLESLRDRTVGLSLALGTLILLLLPFLPGSSFPLISGAVSILSSLCRALISSPQHWTLEKAPSQLRKHTLTCCPEVKSLVSLIYDSYRELLMQVHN